MSDGWCSALLLYIIVVPLNSDAKVCKSMRMTCSDVQWWWSVVTCEIVCLCKTGPGVDDDTWWASCSFMTNLVPQVSRLFGPMPCCPVHFGILRILHINPWYFCPTLMFSLDRTTSPTSVCSSVWLHRNSSWLWQRDPGGVNVFCLSSECQY